MPKTVDTRRHCKVGLRACTNLLQPPTQSLYLGFWGLQKIIASSQPYIVATLWCLLVSTAFGVVSSLYLTLFLQVNQKFFAFYKGEYRDG